MNVAEFFAGIGLVRMGLEQAGFSIVWANDISPVKKKLYANQFGDDHFVLGDIRSITATEVPIVDLATASFPCIDLSLAGNRGGLRFGPHSSTFWELIRILREQGERRPRAVLIENVTGFLSSHGGDDLHIAIAALNELGYACDILLIDAKHFVPQSRPRLFVVAAAATTELPTIPRLSSVRPAKVIEFMELHPDLRFQAMDLPPLPTRTTTLSDVIERLSPDDDRWWGPAALSSFEEQLGPAHRQRLASMVHKPRISWATAYRRTRKLGSVWEIRSDSISGCLRAVSGGSSRQALIEAGQGSWRVRWMTGREYASLQGAPDYPLDGVTENQVLHAFGDAVCVPVIAWLAKNYLAPLIAGQLAGRGLVSKRSMVCV